MQVPWGAKYKLNRMTATQQVSCSKQSSGSFRDKCKGLF